MRLSISEMAKLTGVSIRTLHHYDHIGLLCPETAVDYGYRWYGAADVEKMQQILFYRELDFPLKEIRDILADPQYDKQEALRRQRQLLLLKRERLDGLLELLDANLKGERTMEFQGFDASELEQARRQYADEAKARWSHTDAWKESQARTAKYGDDDWRRAAGGLEDLMAQFAALRDGDPAGAPAQALVAAWQQHITDHFYTCTREILAGLGQMYTADPRFTESIDAHGEGTAAFIEKAIEIYCKKQ